MISLVVVCSDTLVRQREHFESEFRNIQHLIKIQLFINTFVAVKNSCQNTMNIVVSRTPNRQFLTIREWIFSPHSSLLFSNIIFLIFVIVKYLKHYWSSYSNLLWISNTQIIRIIGNLGIYLYPYEMEPFGGPHRRSISQKQLHLAFCSVAFFVKSKQLKGILFATIWLTVAVSLVWKWSIKIETCHNKIQRELIYQFKRFF